ncbi:hypothetical protein JCM19047_842 [Bacillus sp. JCM 19047]|nr:hypothetical protein JCM19047_842 [Bacillus sp. JCM 19047]
MKKGCTICFVGLGLLFSACSQDSETHLANNEIEERIHLEEIVVPTDIFISDTVATELTEDELNASIEFYLNACGDLYAVMDQFENATDSGVLLTEEETKLLAETLTLLFDNDKNFSAYIGENTVPASYEENVELIQQYVTGLNQFLYHFDEKIGRFKDAVENLIGGVIRLEDFMLVGDLPSNVNGKAQQKIENFLKEKGISTHLFDQ